MNYKLDDYVEYCVRHKDEPIYVDGKIVYIDDPAERYPYLLLIDTRRLDTNVREYIESTGYKVRQEEVKEWIDNSKYNKYLKKYEDKHYRLIWADRFDVILTGPLLTLAIILRTLENEVSI